MEFNKILGIYDSNMKLIKKYKNIKELISDIDDFIDEENIELLNWS